MASLAHLAVGVVAGRAWTQDKGSNVAVWRAMLAFSVLSLLPDIDVIGFRFGIRYEDAFGHRGASHAFVTAAVGGLLCAMIAKGHPARRVAVFAGLVLASHGVLDAFTDGGLGPALWWPFSDERVFWAWHPLPVSPIGRGIFSERGAYVLGFEALCCIPAWGWAFWPRKKRDQDGADFIP